jgi:hypothetical protein
VSESDQQENRGTNNPQNISGSRPQSAREFIGNTNSAGLPDSRVDVNVPGGLITITESAEALFRAIGPTQQMFYRGGVVVEVVLQGEAVEVQVVDPVASFSSPMRFNPCCWAPSSP